MSTPAHQELLATGDFMQSGTSQFIVYSMCLLAVVWAAIQTMLIHRMNMDPHRVKIASDFDQISEEDTSNPKNADTPQTPVQCFKMMRHIAELVQSGAITFLKKEYIYLCRDSLLIGRSYQLPLHHDRVPDRRANQHALRIPWHAHRCSHKLAHHLRMQHQHRRRIPHCFPRRLGPRLRTGGHRSLDPADFDYELRILVPS
jgi:hypothetical protein